MNKTTEALKLAENTLRDIIRVYKFETGTPVTALAAIREALAEPVTISCNCGDMYERNSFGGKFIQQYGCCPNCDAAEPVQEPVAVISESAIGLVKLHSNGACLPFGTQLYAAPVSAEPCKECDAKQAKIDSLMLEYCPDEITDEQMTEWSANQKPVSECRHCGWLCMPNDSHSKKWYPMQEPVKQEPVAWDLAEKVRRDLDRKSCPDAYMRIAMESIVKHYAAAIRARSNK